MPKKLTLKPGDIVRVVGERGTATILAILPMHAAFLEKRIGRFRSWNLDELRLVRRGKRRKIMSEEHRAKLRAPWRRTKDRG